MSLQIRSIAIYSKDGEKREIMFKLGALNIVTGGSKTGKSALSDIVDYCWGRSECTVPEGEIRKSVSWFAVLFDLSGEGIVVARRNPGPAGRASDQIYFERGVEELPDSSNGFEKNITSDSLRAQLSTVLGISENVFMPEQGSTRKPLEASASQAIFFSLQAQDEIANRRLLFHRQGEQHVPQAIKDVLPYFLGAIGEDHFLKQKRLDDARIRLRKIERQYNEARSLVNESAESGRTLLEQARRVGLLPQDAIAQDGSSLESLLRDASAPQQFVFSPDADEGTGLAALEEKRRAARNELSELREEIRDLEKLAREVTDFEKEASEQRARLSSIELLPNVSAQHDVCPLCESHLEINTPSILEITKSLKDIEHQLEHARKDNPRLQKRIAELESRFNEKEIVLKSVQADITVRVAQNERLRIEKDQFTEQARVSGRIGYYLENRKIVTEDDGLKLEIARIRAEVSELEASLDQEAVEERVTTALHIVGRELTAYATHLNLEHGDNPLRIDRKNLTVVADTIDGPLSLPQIGSGENWVGYHVAAHLALHKLFRARNRPVPAFLMLDQPSQAHYPPEKDVGEVGTDDEYHVAVTRLYKLLHDYCLQQDMNMQIIAMDHLEILQDWFRDAIVQKWRDGIKLVPMTWLKAE